MTLDRENNLEASEVLSAVVPPARMPHHTYTSAEDAARAVLAAKFEQPPELVAALVLAMAAAARHRAAPSVERDKELEHFTKILCYLQSTYKLTYSGYVEKVVATLDRLSSETGQPRHKDAVRAYVRANPLHYTLNQLAAHARIPKTTAQNMRIGIRTQHAFKENAQKRAAGEQVTRRGRIRTGFLLPLSCARNPVYYHETDAVKDEGTPGYEHMQSPLYIFHAMAWGWRMYANYLESVGETVCPYSGLDLSKLRKNNPHDGSGIRAYQMAAEVLANKSMGSSIVLPVPAFNCAAHELDTWREAARVSVTGSAIVPKYTRQSTLRKMIADECPSHRLREVFDPQTLRKLLGEDEE